MSTLTIAPYGSDAPTGFAPTLASLPVTYSPPSTGARPDVAAVEGAGDWVGTVTAALEEGVRSVVVSNPGIVPVAPARALLDLADELQASIEFAEPYAGDPVFDAHADELAAHLQATAVLILTEKTKALTRAGAIFGTLRTLRRLGVDATVATVSESRASFALTGTAEGKSFFASIAATAVVSSQRVQALGYMKTLDVLLHGSSDARPAEVVVTSMAGAIQLPTVYETPERAAWRRVADAHLAATPATSALKSFIADLDQLEQL